MFTIAHLSRMAPRRPVLALLTAALVVVLDPPAPLSAGHQASAPSFAFTHGPSLQLPTATSITIVWHTNRPCVSRVEYGLTEELGRTAITSRHGLIDNDRTSHVVTLTGLKPGTAYRYRVVSREFLGYEKQHIVTWGETVTSGISSFTTLDPGQSAYSFTVVSDIHENVERLEALLAPVDWKATAFVAFNGDMVNDFMRPEQPFEGFLDAAVARFARTHPIVYSRGNHDVRGHFARRLEDYFATAAGRAYYSFDHGPVHVVVLDSGEDKEDSHEYYNGLVAFEPYRLDQARWLAEDLDTPAAHRARFRILISHIPPRGGGSPAIERVRQAWEDIATRGRVDLWLSGHVHQYLRFDPASGANAYHLLVGAPDRAFDVQVTRDSLDIQVRHENGTVVDRLRVAAR